MAPDIHDDIKKLIVESLALDDVSAAEIDTDEPLFGEGLGLDSIDALELAIAIDRAFGVRLEAKDEDGRAIFRNVRSLAAHVSAHRIR